MAAPTYLSTYARTLPKSCPVQKSTSTSSSASDSDDLNAPELTSGASHHSSSAQEDEINTDVSPISPTFIIPELPSAGTDSLGIGLGLSLDCSGKRGISIISFPTLKTDVDPAVAPNRAASPVGASSPARPACLSLPSDDGYEGEYEHRRGRSACRPRPRHHYHYQHHQPRVVMYRSDSDSDDQKANRPEVAHRPAFNTHQGSQIPPSSPNRKDNPRIRTPSPLGSDQSTPKASAIIPCPSGQHSSRYLQVPEANGEHLLAAALKGLGIRHVSSPSNGRMSPGKHMTPGGECKLDIPGISVRVEEVDPDEPSLSLEQKSKKATLSNTPRRPSNPPSIYLHSAPRQRTRNVSPLSRPHVPSSPPIPPRLRGSPLLAQMGHKNQPRVFSAPVISSAEQMESLMLQDDRMHKHKMFAPDRPKEKRLKYVVTPPPTTKTRNVFDGETTVGFNPYFKVL
ncbi:hypothetical protein DACRYDRAFT_107503 [Dacryopinax primogenitus]|uniref:Uncharacterized protein n=1 Tax=Dacryopinax primogenitus (strain DJM 731) TaxID=1858805 RepID=M5FVE4_DACPD|nr:uncharacterized protein DACRYDRAFT_107503 [Dacryopinax primogenitus]EJU01766.1 hypothetical protein DACRYDRAFT_107503 [Dacryopinax primogenitus]